MEKKLKALFDYQKFAGNSRLEKMIKETERRCEARLSDDDLSKVFAAGNIIEADLRDKKIEK